MADDWDLDKYFWPKDRVLRWWDQGWDWDSLTKKKCPHPDYKTYADFYRPAFYFSDPRVKENPPEISEREYWADRWLSEFPAGSGLKWDPYHLPLYDPHTGALSPKHRDYDGPGKWSDADFKAFARGLKARMRFGTGSSGKKNAPLAGVVVPTNADLSLPGETVYVDFQGATFGDGADFSNATFGNGADFQGATFGNGADFIDAIFGAWANFRGTTFGNMAQFVGATFGDDADFEGATFGVWAIFAAVKFRGWVFFSAGGDESNGSRRGTLVAQDAYAPKAPKFALTLDRQHDTRDKMALRDISFQNAQFCGDVDFSGRQFIGDTDFFGATFHQVPNFDEATFGPMTKFSLGRHFFPPPGRWRWERDGLKDRLKQRWDFFRRPTARSMEFEQAFRRLKTLMMGLGDRTAEHFFYTLEVKSRIKRGDISLLEKLFARLYGWVADFGQSLARPLLWLALWCTFISYRLSLFSGVGTKTFFHAVWADICLFFGWSNPEASNLLPAIHTIESSWIFVLRNLIPGAWLHDLVIDKGKDLDNYQTWINALLEHHTFSVYALAIGHEVVTIALLFLFALALKRKFQIK